MAHNSSVQSTTAAKSRQQDLEAAGHDQIAGQMRAGLQLAFPSAVQEISRGWCNPRWRSPSHNELIIGLSSGYLTQIVRAWRLIS